MTHNYRLPACCCDTCNHKYNNTYDDLMCRQQGNSVIDRGGICDMYLVCQQMEMSSEFYGEVVKEDAPVKTCKNCKHSTFDNKECVPVCTVDMQVINDVDGSCNAYEYEEGM